MKRSSKGSKGTRGGVPARMLPQAADITGGPKSVRVEQADNGGFITRHEMPPTKDGKGNSSYQPDATNVHSSMGDVTDFLQNLYSGASQDDVTTKRRKAAKSMLSAPADQGD